ncbi:MAG: hypothetical protein MJZ57_08650 [Bacteroidales bacterium]|nr:hypothetical protein [Bacteroidales bacterium]
MSTIKKLVTDELQKKDKHCDEEIIKLYIRHYANTACKFYPDNTDGGLEFCSLMLSVMPNFNKCKENPSGEKVFVKAIEKLVEKAIDEQDDLQSFPQLRKKLVEEIVPSRPVACGLECTKREAYAVREEVPRIVEHCGASADLASFLRTEML